MSLDQLMKVHSTRRSDRLWPIEAFTDAVPSRSPLSGDVLYVWPLIVLSEDFLREEKFWEKNADNDVKGNESELHFGRATFPTRRSLLRAQSFPFRRNPPELGAEKQRPLRRPPTTQVRSPMEEAARVRLAKSF